MTAPDIEVILDVRQWREDLQQPEQLAELWSLIEGALAGHDLGARVVHTLEHPDGDIHVRVARVRPGAVPVVGPETRFHIVGVLEAPRVSYRCTACAPAGVVAYGPFVCRGCRDEDPAARLCDAHVRFLDGALIATCDKHAPPCVECGRPAAFRCAGRRCGRRTAHCAAHRVSHPNDPDLAYCPSCFAEVFPRCETAGCGNVGAVRCEVADREWQACGVQVCALHVRRWQVFGGEALGLGLCGRHAGALPGYPLPELVRQIVAGAYARSTRRRDAEPVPSLQGFAHSLRNRGHREFALDYDGIYRLIGALETTMSGREGLQRLVRERRDGLGRYRNRGWTDELDRIRRGQGRGAQLVEHLRQLVRRAVPHDPAMADALRLAEYKPPRTVGGETRPALLFVHLPEQYRSAFIGRGGENIRAFGQQLSMVEPAGVTVKIEGDVRGRRR